MEEIIKAWVARDQGNNHAGLYINQKPIKDEIIGMWTNYKGCCSLDDTQFPDAKWEDDEPTEVKITIKLK